MKNKSIEFHLLTSKLLEHISVSLSKCLSAYVTADMKLPQMRAISFGPAMFSLNNMRGLFWNGQVRCLSSNIRTGTWGSSYAPPWLGTCKEPVGIPCSQLDFAWTVELSLMVTEMGECYISGESNSFSIKFNLHIGIFYEVDYKW